jgi:transposase
MESIARQRLRWVRHYEATGDAGLTCRRCGISRPTLRLWVRRYRRDGEAGLVGLSRRPWRSPRRKLNAPERELILSLRLDRNLGARRIQSQLRLLHDTELSITSLQKVLSAASVAPLRKTRRSVIPKRYSRPIPGDRVQMDTMKIVPGVINMRPSTTAPVSESLGFTGEPPGPIRWISWLES